MSAKWRNILVVAALIAALGSGVLSVLSLSTPAEEPIARSYQTACYLTDGGDKFVCASGGEIEIQSGGTFDLQSGATTDFSSGIDLDGGLLDLDANGNTSLQADTDDQIDIEISGADDFQFTADTFSALSGSTIKADTIAETTSAAGVTIDGLKIKDAGIAANVDVTGTFQYGSDDLTPLAFDSTTQYEVYVGSASSVTQTVVTSATHLCTTAVDWGICFVSDPDADAGDPAYCTISISGTDITFQALDDDGDNAANAATKIYYMVIGR